MQDKQRSTYQFRPSDIVLPPDCDSNLVHAQRALKALTKNDKAIPNKASAQYLQAKAGILEDLLFHLQQQCLGNRSCLSVICDPRVIFYLKLALNESLCRTPCLKILRLLMISESVSQIYLQNNIPIYLSRILERDDAKKPNDSEDQVLQALRLIKNWVQFYPNTFPKLLGAVTLALGDLPVSKIYQTRKKDHISPPQKLEAVDVVILIAIRLPQLCLELNGFEYLANMITEPAVGSRSQEIVRQFLFLLNQRHLRIKYGRFIGISKVFALFTDHDNISLQQSARTKGNLENKEKWVARLHLAKHAIITMLKSWTGLICVGSNPSLLESFIVALKQIPRKQDSQVRRAIFDVLQELIFVGQFQKGNAFCVSNLTNFYLVTLLELLIERGLLKTLVELSSVNQNGIAQRSQRLLKKLSLTLFTHIPHGSGRIDFLLAPSAQDSPLVSYSSSFMINRIGNYIYEADTPQCYHILLRLKPMLSLDSLQKNPQQAIVRSLAKSLNHLQYRWIPQYRKKLLEGNPIPKDEKNNYKSWDWKVIIDLLSFPGHDRQGPKPDGSQKHKEGKLFRHLLRFYSFLRGNFGQQKWHVDNLTYLAAGTLFIKNIVSTQEQLELVKTAIESQFDCTFSFMSQEQNVLKHAINESTRSARKYYSKYFKTFERELVQWIGMLSLNKQSYQQLLCSHEFFEILFDCLPRDECGLIVAGVMLYLDYTHEDKIKRDKLSKANIKIGPKQLLYRAVQTGSTRLRLFCIQVILMLFEAKLAEFQADGLKLLIKIVLCQNRELQEVAMQAIQQLCKQEELLSLLIKLLREISQRDPDKCNSLLDGISRNIKLNLLSTSQGFDLITHSLPLWLETEYQSWFQGGLAEQYFEQVESLMNAKLQFTPLQPNKHNRAYVLKGMTAREAQFAHKLPWLLQVNDEEAPLWVRIHKGKLTLTCQFTNQSYDFLNATVLRVSLNIGSMPVNELFQLAAKPVETLLDLTEHTQILLYGKPLFLTTHNGFSAYFTMEEQELRLKRLQLSVLLQNNEEQQTELPMHFMREIAKTAAGRAYVEAKNILKFAKDVLHSPEEYPPLQVRAVLWSLCNYGAHNEACQSLHSRGLVESLIQMSLSQATLSLRGTCRYILNYLCLSKFGRDLLSSRGFIIHQMSLNCFLKDSKQFYTLHEQPSLSEHMEESQWKEYLRILKPLTAQEDEFFGMLRQGMNAWSIRHANLRVKELLRLYPKIANSFNLLQNVTAFLSTFKMKHEHRKNIMSLFEEFARSGQFYVDGNGKIDYILPR